MKHSVDSSDAVPARHSQLRPCFKETVRWHHRQTPLFPRNRATGSAPSHNTTCGKTEDLSASVEKTGSVSVLLFSHYSLTPTSTANPVCMRTSKSHSWKLLSAPSDVAERRRRRSWRLLICPADNKGRKGGRGGQRASRM